MSNCLSKSSSPTVSKACELCIYFVIHLESRNKYSHSQSLIQGQLPVTGKIVLLLFNISLHRKMVIRVEDWLNFILTHCILGNFSCFCRLLIFFSKLTFSKNSFRNTIRMSNSLDPDPARRYQQTTLADKELIAMNSPLIVNKESLKCQTQQQLNWQTL